MSIDHGSLMIDRIRLPDKTDQDLLNEYDKTDPEARSVLSIY